MSPRQPPKISLRYDWTEDLGSKVVQLDFQPTQATPNPIRDRSGQPGKDTVAVQNDPEVYHEIKTLNTDNETIRERIEEDMDIDIQKLAGKESWVAGFFCLS